MRPRRAFVVAFAVLLVAQAAVAAGATRAEGLGWQYELFTDNVTLTYSPTNPTPADTVVIRIESNNPSVPIYSVTTLLTYQIPGMPASTSGLPFFPVNSTVQEGRLSLSAFANNTVVTFRVMVYDVKYSYIVSDNYTFTVIGSARSGGWRHSLFEDNLDMTWSPQSPNATESVKVTINSRDGIGIYGAYVYVTYNNVSGGYPMQVVNATCMECSLPGYSKGTMVEFWVTAWDKYTNITTSTPRNFTVITGEDRMSHDFVEFDAISAMAGLMAFSAVGGAAFLRVLASERARRRKATQYGRSSAENSCGLPMEAEEGDAKPGSQAPKGAGK
jgi:hypothetical protein